MELSFLLIYIKVPIHTLTYKFGLGPFVNKKDASLIVPFKIAEGKESK